MHKADSLNLAQFFIRKTSALIPSNCSVALSFTRLSADASVRVLIEKIKKKEREKLVKELSELQRCLIGFLFE